MKHEFRIFPKKKQIVKRQKQSSSWNFKWFYQIASKVYFMTNSFEFVTMTVSEYNKESQPNEGQPGGNNLDIRNDIWNNNRRETVVVFEEGDERLKGFLEFWSKYPANLLETADKHNDAAYVCVHDMSKMKNERAITARLKNEVSNAIYAMDESELRDVLYRFGHVPTGLSREEMEVTLIDPNEGVLFDEATNNIDTFNREFIKKTDTSTDLTISINKAKALGIISKQDIGKGKGWYYGKDNFLGVEENDIINYFQQNEKLRDSLLASIKAKSASGTGSSFIKKEHTPEKAINRATMVAEISAAVREKRLTLPESIKASDIPKMKSEDLKPLYESLAVVA